MKIAVYSRTIRREHLPLYKKLFNVIENNDIEYVVNDITGAGQLSISKKQGFSHIFYNHQDLAGMAVDFFLTIGGDGTFLDALNYVKDLGIPVLGLNTGRLGFLSNNQSDSLESICHDLINGKYCIDDRTLISLESSEDVFEDKALALNDFTIHKRDSSSLTAISAYLNGSFFNTYWADGIIVSTPTGSTAYSLSCGGPVVFPGSETFIITPVAPHNLNVRPVVVPDYTEIKFEIMAREKKFMISLDSRYKVVNHNCTILIRKAPFKMKTVRFSGQHFSKVLQDKLIWGADTRNI